MNTKKVKTYPKRMVQNIISRLKHYRENDEDIFIDRAHQYTGFHRKFLEDLWHSDDKSIEPEELVHRSVILEELISFYLNDTMPSVKELFMQLCGKMPKWIDIKQFRKILKQMDFTRIRMRKKHYVFERSTVTIFRLEYLQKIINYRKEDKNIVYICESAYDFLGNCYDTRESSRLSKLFPLIKLSCWIYAVTRDGIYNFKKIDKFDANTIHNYAIELSKDFNIPTVFVYDKSKYHSERVCKPPSLRTLKVDLMKWLEIHDIPYDPNACKYHLYELIKKHKDADESLFTLDRILIAEGHLVLRIPHCISYMFPGHYLAQAMQNNIRLHNKDTNPNEFALLEYDKEKLQAYDKLFVDMIQFDAVTIIDTADIIGQEIKMFETDVKIDGIIDSVRSKVKRASKTIEVQPLALADSE